MGLLQRIFWLNFHLNRQPFGPYTIHSEHTEYLVFYQFFIQQRIQQIHTHFLYQMIHNVALQATFGHYLVPMLMCALTLILYKCMWFAYYFTNLCRFLRDFFFGSFVFHTSYWVFFFCSLVAQVRYLALALGSESN